MENSARGMQIERKSSIETEPRTLNFDQMHFAREAALFVLNNRSFKEAQTIFSEGLEPARSVSFSMEKEDEVMFDSDEDSDFIAEEIQLHPLPQGYRGVASAPF